MRLLLIDDAAEDRARIIQELKTEFPNAEFVEILRREDFDAALARGDFDVVVAEYRIAWTDGFWILRTIRARFPDMPVFMITDSGSEEVAVEGMKSGLSDYILKRQWPRLPAAVREGLQTAKRRKEMEASYRMLADNSAYGFWHITLDGLTIYLNSTMCAMLEIERPEDLAGRTYHSFFTPESLPIIAREHAKRQQGIASRYEVEIVGARGRQRNVIIAGAPVFGPDGQLQSLIGTFTDITDHRQLEKARRESEERYRELLENANDMIYTHDREGNFTSINKAGERITGYRREEALRMNILDIIVPEQQARAQQIINRQVAEGIRMTYDLEVMAKDGRRVALEVSAQPVFREGKVVGAEGIARDMTDRQRLEAQLRQAQKMESIGTLAGGIAHDFNNILTGIIGFAELGLSGLSTQHPVYRSLYEIQRLGDRAANLTRQLMTFARKQVLDPKEIDLNVIISDLDRFLQSVIGEHIELHITKAEDLAAVYADAAQIEQVIINLCINARDAMPHGGQLWLETQNVRLDASYCGNPPWMVPGEYVRLSVRDTGVGVDRVVRERMFDPFFTTKEPGQGTGLGLAIVYGIIQQHHGIIDVYSEVGRGTAFDIYLPAAAGSPAVIDRGAVQAPPGGHETILVAEDEAPVRNLIVSMLRARGYCVLVASNGEEALRAFEAEPEGIDLVLSDVVMPKLGGRQLYEILHTRYPKLKFLFISGYSVHVLNENFFVTEGLDFLQKPFKPIRLILKVREVLDKN